MKEQLNLPTRNKVIVIGNGVSRKGFDLEKLRPHGKIYGCNALYRDFMPDVLTSVDHGIMHEIYNNGVADEIPCYFRDWTRVPQEHYEMMKWAGLNLDQREKVKKHFDAFNENEKGLIKTSWKNVIWLQILLFLIEDIYLVVCIIFLFIKSMHDVSFA